MTISRPHSRGYPHLHRKVPYSASTYYSARTGRYSWKDITMRLLISAALTMLLIGLAAGVQGEEETHVLF